MSTITIDENRLEEIVDQSVRKHLKTNLDDVEEVRRSPAGVIVRIETRLEAIEKNMATKADLATLKTELSERIANSEKGLSERIANSEKGLSERIANSVKGLSERIANSEKGLSERIANSEKGLSERIAKVETSLKLIFAMLLSMLALLIKSVFFS